MKIWLVCSDCGYSQETTEEQMIYFTECPLCEGKMKMDTHQGTKIRKREPTCNSQFNTETCKGCSYYKYCEGLIGDKIEKSKLPKITRNDVEDFIIDLNNIFGVDDWEKKFND